MYAIAGCPAIVVYFLLPSTTAQNLFYISFGLITITAILAGVRWHRPAQPLPWYLLALGLLLTVGGDALWAAYEILLHNTLPFPSPADILYLAAYPFFGTSIYLLTRSRGAARQWPHWLDATVVALGFGLISWIFLMKPYAVDNSLTLTEQVISIAYPLMDIVLVAVAAQAAFQPGARSLALRCILASLSAMVIADTLFSVFTLNGTYHTGHVIDLGWLLSHLGWALAALHPSMRALHESDGRAVIVRLSWRRLALLSVAMLLAPGMLLFQFAMGQPIDVPVIGVTSIVLIACALLRLQGAVRLLTETLGRAEHQALHDALTGLPNRMLFLDRLEQACVRADRHASSIAVLFLDLDRFKIVNDSLGHAVGDALLVAVTQRLAGCLRQQDTLARMSGDEFTILLEDMHDAGQAELIAQRILASLEPAITIDGHTISAGVSIGIAIHRPTAYRPADLMRYADVAMYQAKLAGKGRYAVFAPSMNAQAITRLELEQELRQALERHELVLHYQPIVAIDTRRVVGVEALLRWQHPARGLLAPVHFMALAEETGLIVPIGRWVLEQGCRQMQQWRQLQPFAADMQLNVNLSARQFQSPTLVDDIAAALAGSRLPPSQLTLEITESVVMDRAAQSIATLHRLRALGVRLVIDDFGTGYSSLSYLHRLEVDGLKIDRSLALALAADSAHAAIVRAIINLAHALGLVVTAEGVETADQAARLAALGGDLAQGCYLHPPLPWPALASLLDPASARVIAA